MPMADFGRDIRDFPRNADWVSPFAQTAQAARLQLFDGFEITYPTLPNFSPMAVPLPQCRLSLATRELNATIQIAASELPPGCPLDQIAGAPFLNYLKLGARSPVVMSVPIITNSGVSGHMINAPLMIPGSFIGDPSITMLPMFKHTMVLALEGCWFSFESQAWGVDLDIALEVQAQTKLHEQFGLAYKEVPLEFDFPKTS